LKRKRRKRKRKREREKERKADTICSLLSRLALLVHIHLRINRVDEAEKVVQGMHTLEDDATMTQLTTAWLNIALGGEKFKEAQVRIVVRFPRSVLTWLFVFATVYLQGAV
jgi:hypothetical protein